MKKSTVSKADFILPDEPISGKIDVIKTPAYLRNHYLVIRVDKRGNSGEPLEGTLIGYTEDRRVAYSKLKDLREESAESEYFADFAHSEYDKKREEIFIV